MISELFSSSNDSAASGIKSSERGLPVTSYRAFLFRRIINTITSKTRNTTEKCQYEIHNQFISSLLIVIATSGTETAMPVTALSDESSSFCISE